MQYNASVSDFFKSPKWTSNISLGAVTMLIPLVGPMVLSGWHVTGLWARGDHADPAEFPPFDFQNFVKYLERGLWPFLVNLVSSLVLVPLVMIVLFPALLASAGSQHHGGHAAGLVLGVLFVGMFFLQALMMLAYYFIATPLVLRATITQDFKSAFDFSFVKYFLSRVWKELLASMIYLFCLSLGLMVIAVCTCYIGAFFASPVVMFSWHHLQKQLYQLYLARGGDAVPLSPKLRDIPPTLPAA